MFYSMVGKCIMTLAVAFNILATNSADDWIFSSYIVWITDDPKRAIFVALMTVAVEIIIEERGICVW